LPAAGEDCHADNALQRNQQNPSKYTHAKLKILSKLFTVMFNLGHLKTTWAKANRKFVRAKANRKFVRNPLKQAWRVKKNIFKDQLSNLSVEFSAALSNNSNTKPDAIYSSA